MLGRGGLCAEKGETEEREERQSSPLGHHFSQINRAAFRNLGDLKENTNLESPGHLLKIHKREKKFRVQKCEETSGARYF